MHLRGRKIDDRHLCSNFLVLISFIIIASICWLVFDFRYNNPTGDTKAAGGDVQWTANGVAVTTNLAPQSTIQAVMGGVISTRTVFWLDERAGWGGNEIYKSTVSSAGSVSENTKVVSQSGVNETHVNLQAINDGSGNLILAWNDNRLGDQDIYLEKVSNDSFEGGHLWGNALINVAEISAGDGHNCLRLTDNTLRCWGEGGDGQLGNDNTLDTIDLSINLVPTLSPVSEAIDVNKVVAGGSHSCAYFSNNTVKCWGDNFYGQLGDSTNNDKSIPESVSSINTATDIATGGSHSCAVLSTGVVNCWGANPSGQLGNGFNINSNIPVAVSSITTAIAITAGKEHSCALLSDNTVQCWGENTLGQLGNGANIDSNIPVAVSVINNATAIASRYNHTCALLSDNTIKCWGAGTNGELGNGADLDSNVPVAVTGITTATQISTGGSHSCAVLSNQMVQCWGLNNHYQLGDGTLINSNVPVTVSTASPAEAVAAGGGIGGGHTCVLLTDDTVKCWGAGTVGKLGNGGSSDSSSPVSLVNSNFGIKASQVWSDTDETNPKLISDTAGGAIVVWQDNRDGDWDIYAQRFNSTSTPLWAVKGVPITTVAGDQTSPQVMSDGAGGAIIVWDDDRNDNGDIYAQKINSNGVIQWSINGINISTGIGELGAGQQKNPKIVNSIIFWQDVSLDDISVKKIDSNGDQVWKTNLSATVDTSVDYQIVGAGSNDSAIVVWQDTRSDFGDIYAQYVNNFGTFNWTAGGLPIAVVTGSQTEPAISINGSGGVFISWSDPRNGALDIYAQEIGTWGDLFWTTNGIVLCGASGAQQKSKLLYNDSFLYTFWEDSRSGNWDIYAQSVEEGASVVNTAPVVGYSADNIIPVAQISQSTNGTGIMTINFRVKDIDGNAVTLNTFEYSIDGGVIFSAPTNGDTSQSIYITTPGDSWTNNLGSNYTTAIDWTGTIYSLKFNTGHVDVAGLSGVDQDDVQIRFKANDGTVNSASGVSESFIVDNLSPVVLATVNIITRPSAGNTTVLIGGGTFTEAHPNTNDFYLGINGGAYGSATAGDVNTTTPANLSTAVGATLDGDDCLTKVKITHTDDYGNQGINEQTSPSFNCVIPYIPQISTVSNVSDNSVRVAINKNGAETGAVEYEIYETVNLKYVQVDGSLGISSVWQTYSTWGGSSGIIVSGLNSDSNYRFKVRARNPNDSNVISAYSGEASISTTTERRQANSGQQNNQNQQNQSEQIQEEHNEENENEEEVSLTEINDEKKDEIQKEDDKQEEKTKAPDQDSDDILDENDNCLSNYNPDQQDVDNDKIGDVCDICPLDGANDCLEDKKNNDFDQDGIIDDLDNCLSNYNPNQSNIDQDLLGDVCDICPEDPLNSCDNEKDNNVQIPQPPSDNDNQRAEGELAEKPLESWEEKYILSTNELGGSSSNENFNNYNSWEKLIERQEKILESNNLKPQWENEKVSLPQKEQELEKLNIEDIYLDKVVVKFNDVGEFLIKDGFLVNRLNGGRDTRRELEIFNKKLKEAKGYLSYYFYDLNESDYSSLKINGEISAREELPFLGNWIVINLPLNNDLEYFKKLFLNIFSQVNNLNIVELIDVEPVPQLPESDQKNTTVSADKLDLIDQQGYLNSINLNYAYNYVGGRGELVKIIDVEGGWNLSHEDLPNIFFQGGVMQKSSVFIEHGTAVLGEIAGKNNKYGILGVAHKSKIGVVSFGGTSVANAISLAVKNLSKGDILLIELQAKGPSDDSGACLCNCSQFEQIPMEYWQADYDIIKTAVNNGIVVVSAAGNGSVNLDDARYGKKFDRLKRDSGAIFVTGVNSKNKEAHCWSNYGSRVDLNSWGDSVYTAGYGDVNPEEKDGNKKFTKKFKGSSSAAPIIAGSAAILQSIYQVANHGKFLSSMEIRDILTKSGEIVKSKGKKLGASIDLKKSIKLLPNNPPISITDSNFKNGQKKSESSVDLKKTMELLSDNSPASVSPTGLEDESAVNEENQKEKNNLVYYIFSSILLVFVIGSMIAYWHITKNTSRNKGTNFNSGNGE